MFSVQQIQQLTERLYFMLITISILKNQQKKGSTLQDDLLFKARAQSSHR
ncbi:unnamed protein product [Larinioides sclopetarius]|uniref:Uncharacterized protein n=1 Tax=Larinioides sclopetarius TaxID=280406 RepID=A0AAV2A5P8_9ARAC